LFVLELTTDHLRTVVLIADDEVLLRNLLRQALRKDYEVLIAANGIEALQLSREMEGVIHVLLTNGEMPGMDGFSLVRQIRRERPQIRILLLSDVPSDALRASGESFSYLRKPFELNELGARLKDLLAEPGLDPKEPKVILVVDDNLTRRDRTRRILADHGYAVLTARTPQHAAQIAEGISKIDLIVAGGEDGWGRDPSGRRSRCLHAQNQYPPYLTLQSGSAQETTRLFGAAGVSAKSVHA
jgi:CheY-like chemotaxis protein